MLTGLVLAAGASARMGRPKDSLPIGAETFLVRILRVIRGTVADHVIVVVAQHSRKHVYHKNLPETAFVQSAGEPTEGQIGSIRTGVSFSLNRAVDALVVWPVDHPAVTETTVRHLAAAFLRSRRPVVVPVYHGHRGHPVIFSRVVFSELAAARGPGGAKPVVRRDPDRVLEVPVDDPGVLEDIDTPQDYDLLLKRLAGSEFV